MTAPSDRDDSSFRQEMASRHMASEDIDTANQAATASSSRSLCGGGEKLQRHRSYHCSSASSKNSSRLKRFEDKTTSHHRRATSVRVRPTHLVEEDDPSYLSRLLASKLPALKRKPTTWRQIIGNFNTFKCVHPAVSVIPVFSWFLRNSYAFICLGCLGWLSRRCRLAYANWAKLVRLAAYET